MCRGFTMIQGRDEWWRNQFQELGYWKGNQFRLHIRDSFPALIHRKILQDQLLVNGCYQ